MVLAALLSFSTAAQDTYFPPRGEWAEKSPADLGVSGSAIDRLIDFAMDNEVAGSRDLRIAIALGFEREPYHRIAGPGQNQGGTGRHDHQGRLRDR